ncbi:type VI secretion system-associated protein TagF [Colwellia sp. E2M01]|uniref:type VI secretion system-associated protein TagF n=1 Tax=Colwellia sp. E2M01 TaxID=2841561 RepID=UPI001C09B2F7|nr:type VI secretion system-associated protein TagF [Colwellia sp. E2M01]MBU2870481.1 type VI secretion system-associated protein TagF [Colwellia sp. E2M01]
MSNNPIDSIGFCGKIPIKGDFVQSKLNNDFLKHWNEWLQAVIAVSKEQLEDDWLDCYLTSPIWHFSLSAGICCDSPMIGTVIPSIDQVNRPFPFTLATEHNNSALQGWYKNTWSEKFEEMILKVLNDDFDFDDWCTMLSNEEVAIQNTKTNSATRESEDKIKKAWVIKGDSPPELLDLLHHQYSHHYGRYSLWWTLGSYFVEPCLIITEGLPQVSQFSAMLNGQWQENNWNVTKILKE